VGRRRYPVTGGDRGLLARIAGPLEAAPVDGGLLFTGLRASELRGLRWEDIDLPKRELHVRQRADRYNKIGKPKSGAGQRTVPLISYVANGLREWKLTSKSKDGLVFPTNTGKANSL